MTAQSRSSYRSIAATTPPSPVAASDFFNSLLGVEVFLQSGGPFYAAHRRTIIELVRTHRWPAIYSFRMDAVEGGLMSYGSDMEGLYRTQAAYVDKILKGASPGDLPIEQATKLALVINLKTARELGLQIPQVLLANASELIE